MEDLWQRLKQRKLVQWAAAYIAAAFALIQVLDVVAQRFGLPDRIEKLIILALVVGFFVVLVLAWYHGERRAQRLGGTELVIIVLLLVTGGVLIWRFGVVARSPDGVKPNPGTAIADNVAGTAVSGPRIASATQAIPTKSVAVLPFANESGDKSQQFFSDGLSDDLITALSQFSGLKVISRDSAFQFRDSRDSSAKIGKLLGVAHLLEGSVQRAGDKVRITATLVKASDGSILWSQRYDKPYKDLFALQDAITRSVAGALKAKLLTAPGAVLQSDRPPSGNLDAYAAYQHGVAYDALSTEAGTRQAIAAFREAARIDPQYAVACAKLSLDLSLLASQYGVPDSAEQIAKARDAAAKALALDPKLALAHLARANLLLKADMDWTGAEAQAQRALRLAPNDATVQAFLGVLMSALGHTRRAADLARQAIQSDPRRAGRYYQLSRYLTATGHLEEARQAALEAIELRPHGAISHVQLTIIEILLGKPEAALAAAQKEPAGPWRDVAIALASQIGANRGAADAALHKLIAAHAGDAAYQIADVYALRRDPDNMFKWLDRAWADRDPGISHLLYDPLILHYQHDPRFAAFCKKVGLPATTDAVAMKP